MVASNEVSYSINHCYCRRLTCLHIGRVHFVAEGGGGSQVRILKSRVCARDTFYPAAGVLLPSDGSTNTYGAGIQVLVEFHDEIQSR